MLWKLPLIAPVINMEMRRAEVMKDMKKTQMPSEAAKQARKGIDKENDVGSNDTSVVETSQYMAQQMVTHFCDFMKNRHYAMEIKKEKPVKWAITSIKDNERFQTI